MGDTTDGPRENDDEGDGARRDRDGDERSDDELPRDAADDAERLTRFARGAVDGDEATVYRERRDELLAEHEFTARVRDESDGDVLVLHPAEWHDDGVVRTERIEDVSRAVEIPLEGAGDPDEWSEVEACNRELAAAVRDAHGDVHGDNAEALADFMGNHYAKPMASATTDELAVFLTEYFPRNAWPSDEQRAAVERSIALVFETAGEPAPEFR